MKKPPLGANATRRGRNAPVSQELTPSPDGLNYDSMSHEQLRRQEIAVVAAALNPPRAREYVRSLLAEALHVQHNITVHRGLLRASIQDDFPDYVMDEGVIDACVEAISHESDRLADVLVTLEEMLGVQWEPEDDTVTPFMRSTPPRSGKGGDHAQA